MTDHILLEVVTPECRVLSTRVSEVQFRTAARGYYGILPGHTPTLTPLGDGLLHYTQGGEKRWITVFGGFAEVGPEHVTILARLSETLEKLDPAKVKAEAQQAEKRLKEAQTPEDLEQARTALDACLVRMQALGHSDHQL
ncbi:MAG TPA: ATP synthase F1 subunit epsilon [Holophaga sp.]|nr:ATP synthase F1 subunit epsilon [Holophaga sp.]HPS66408.1 ATP synthase F1 subunit epsilon [Holophaga sp.]